MSSCSVHNLKGSTSLKDLACRYLPKGEFRHILIKPNWVYHQESSSFPIYAQVTDSGLIENVVDACVDKYPGLEEITIGDVPLQSCDWELLVRQAGIDRLIDKYQNDRKPRIRILDLRREHYVSIKGYLEKLETSKPGDPKGYREVYIDASSFLEEISDERDKFRVSDYNPQETISSHQKGHHRYFISGSVLDCDLFINMPKMKTHQKAGVTGALKNVVGVNGKKEYLVHYRAGTLGRGGDEFPMDTSRLVILQSWVRGILQKKSKTLFRVLRQIWKPIRAIGGIEVNGVRANLDRSFYIAGGSWYGNDTLWRMIYDLNRIILYAGKDGGLRKEPQRAYLTVMDGLTAGEGNGPLQSLPVDLMVVLFSDDPFLTDGVMAQMMGFDYQKIPMISNFRRFPSGPWAVFDPDRVEVRINDKSVYGLQAVPVLYRFIPPPGWKRHIEAGS
jgi:hypothetical protein